MKVWESIWPSNPIDITASTILRFVQGSKRVVSSVLIQGQAEIMEIIASHHMKLIDRPLSELEIPDGVIVAAIHRGLNVIIPNGDTIIQEGGSGHFLQPADRASGTGKNAEG